MFRWDDCEGPGAAVEILDLSLDLTEDPDLLQIRNWLTVGEKLRETRKNAKLSQADLAKILGVSRSMVFHYETGICRLCPRALCWIFEQEHPQAPF